ncbi:hypothetical protein CYCME_1047 [Cycloclasticus zancles 78-ME]|uniref:Uncharacterized protein n=1 Tax=Cycloclasticus zancles 78-ME TaxID=1198232 RepID=S5T753_9GAMM|nr:hypothetical protein CYCME_1047 [Cycloclasticus zancles 78-ME]
MSNLNPYLFLKLDYTYKPLHKFRQTEYFNEQFNAVI